MGFFDRLVDGSLMPHGHCLLWRPDLLVMHVGGDALTVISYFAIPPALLVLRRKRSDLAFDKVFLMFAAFIFLCGITHLMGIINVWEGFYFMHGIAKVSTGLVSVATAIAVWILLPKAIAIPSMASLQMNADVLSRTEEELADARQQLAELEACIEEKTSILNAVNSPHLSKLT